MTTRHWMVLVLGAIAAVLTFAPATAEQPVRERAIDRDFAGGVEASPKGLYGQFNFISSASGFQEVPSVVTQGRAILRARLNVGGDGIDYRLDYDLEGDVTGAHIHIGQSGVNGAVALWLCSNSPISGGFPVPPCPGPSSGNVSGTLYEEDITPQAAAQGVVDLQTLLAAMMSRVTYVNVHSDRYPEGEVRGQLARLRVSSHGSLIRDSELESDGDDW